MANLQFDDEKDGDTPVTIHYFVDEAGTPTLFQQGGKVIVGEQGCSTYFFLGKLDVGDPVALDAELTALRAEILADPYYRGVPSLDPSRGKTAVQFHAKDDLPEIRAQVFHLLMQHDLRFSAVVRDKRKLVEQVQALNKADSTYRYRENEIYDDLVSHLFKSGFHEADRFRIVFAKRGNKDRTAAFQQAIENARASYEAKFGVKAASHAAIDVSIPRLHAGLQAVDYFLWALQRFYERAPDSADDRYWELVRPKARLVHDIDDTSEHSYGRYYTPDKPLTRETFRA
jgi:hypothetical protein